MKDGKPEVLIIGEDHPDILHSKIPFHLPAEENLTKEERNELFKNVRQASYILKKEIIEIKKFGAAKILLEQSRTEKSEQIAKELKETKNLEQFQIDYAAFDYAIYEKLQAELRNTGMIFLVAYKPGLEKILPFLIGATGVYNIGFFDDEKLGIEDALLIFIHGNIAYMMKEYKKISREREEKMVENIREMLEDKTVIICGAAHVSAIKKGLKGVAFVHKPIIVRKPGALRLFLEKRKGFFRKPL